MVGGMVKGAVAAYKRKIPTKIEDERYFIMHIYRER